MNRDRYIRLKAIKEFGYDIDWDELKKCRVGIVGVGGIGVVSSEMVVRCGVKKVSLFDYDTVDVVNLNRCMFKPEHIGQLKVKVAAKILKEINPDIEIGCFNNDIMNPDFEKAFEREIKQMDIVLNGLDNVPARDYLNVKCVSLNVPYIDAGASRSGLSGYVHPIVPYKTACAKCINSIAIDIPNERGESCVASLPSTMSILASMQIQEMLKYLFKLGEMIDYVMYNMLTGTLLHYSTKRDENCPVCGSKKETKEILSSKITKSELDDLINKIKE